MSLPISKLMDLGFEKKTKPMENLSKSRGLQAEYPERFKELKGIQKSTNINRNFIPDDFDQYGVAMRDTKDHRGQVGLSLQVNSKVKLPYKFYQTDGWIDPAQRRRAVDPNSAPPYEYAGAGGSAYQEFENDEDEMVSHNNVDLVRKAHESYYNQINRYNIKPKGEYIDVND